MQLHLPRDYKRTNDSQTRWKVLVSSFQNVELIKHTKAPRKPFNRERENSSMPVIYDNSSLCLSEDGICILWLLYSPSWNGFALFMGFFSSVVAKEFHFINSWRLAVRAKEVLYEFLEYYGHVVPVNCRANNMILCFITVARTNHLRRFLLSNTRCTALVLGRNR